jgi:squalene-hopene/tetraprenyl-beta-curcumene cyclase
MSQEDAPESSPAPRRAPLGKTLLKYVAAVVCVLVAAAAYLYYFQMTGHSEEWRPAKVIAPTSDKIMDSIRRGADYLERHQESDGHFSKGWVDPKPAFTALIVDALARSPVAYREKEHPFLKKAAAAIIEKQQSNGSLCSPVLGLDTYSTAMSVMALVSLENPEYKPVIDKASEFLRSVQYQDDEMKSLNYGGAGYSKGGNPSGDQTALWIESLKAAGVKEGDPAFKRAEKYLQRLQNNTETNDKPNVNGTPITNDGGFNYRPGESKVVEVQPNGQRLLKSYGLMSYAGLKSFMYMSIPKTDPRVASAYKWVKENYTLDENRNIGPDGLYYYYQTMAKALAAYGERTITGPDGVKHDWPKELSDKLIALQNADGCWYNKDSSRWYENDKVMVTAFAIRTLSICHDFMREHPEK